MSVRDRIQKIVAEGIGRKAFALLFIGINVAFGFLLYAIVAYQMTHHFRAVETLIQLFLAGIMCVLFYLRLKQLRKPMILSVLPFMIVINSFQMYAFLDLGPYRFNILDLFNLFYLVVAVWLMAAQGEKSRGVARLAE